MISAPFVANLTSLNTIVFSDLLITFYKYPSRFLIYFASDRSVSSSSDSQEDEFWSSRRSLIGI